MALALSRQDGAVHALTPADAPALHRLVGGTRYTVEILTRELVAGDHYRWVGVHEPDGQLAGAHRALLWGDHLFLKGVFVDPAARGSATALRLAFALRDNARQEGRRGIAAWISAHSPAQVVLGRRLRLEETGPSLHLYALALDPTAPQRRFPPSRALAEAEQVVERHSIDAGDQALVPDLLMSPPTQRARCLPDRDHLLVGGLPCAGPGQVSTLVADLAPFAASMAVSAVEFPAPSTDVLLALWLAGQRAWRISKRPVRLGRAAFRPQEL